MHTQKVFSSFLGVMLALVCIIKPIVGSAQQGGRKGNIVTFNGNKFTFSTQLNDTIFITDPVSGKQIVKLRAKAAEPIAMNGKKIHKEEGVPAQSFIDSGSLEDYVMRNLSKEIKALPDGEYGISIKDLVVDDSGKLVYYNFTGIDKQDFEHYGQAISGDTLKPIKEKVEKLLSAAPRMKPGSIKGKVVVSLLPSEFLRITITVKNHVAAYYKI